MEVGGFERSPKAQHNRNPLSKLNKLVFGIILRQMKYLHLGGWRSFVSISFWTWLGADVTSIDSCSRWFKSVSPADAIELLINYKEKGFDVINKLQFSVWFPSFSGQKLHSPSKNFPAMAKKTINMYETFHSWPARPRHFVNNKLFPLC